MPVPWHRGEEMVDELRVHPAPQPSLQPVHVSLPRAPELDVHELASLLEHDLLGLVRRRHQRAHQEPAQQDGRDGHAERQAAEEPSVVHGEQGELLLILALDRGRERVAAPEDVGERVERVSVPVLPPAEARVVGPPRHLGRLEEIEGLELDVPVPPVDVGERVVHVVLVLPPLGAETVRQRSEPAHHRAPLAAAVDVVVREPTSLLHPEADGTRREDRMRVGQEPPDRVQPQRGTQHRRLLQRIAPEPPLVVELFPERRERRIRVAREVVVGVEPGVGREDAVRGGYAGRYAGRFVSHPRIVLLLVGPQTRGEHGESPGGGVVAVGSVRVQRVEDVGGVAAIHEGDEERASGVRPRPAGAVVPDAVDAEPQFLAGVFLLADDVVGGLVDRVGNLDPERGEEPRARGERRWLAHVVRVPDPPPPRAGVRAGFARGERVAAPECRARRDTAARRGAAGHDDRAHRHGSRDGRRHFGCVTTYPPLLAWLTSRPASSKSTARFARRRSIEGVTPFDTSAGRQCARKEYVRHSHRRPAVCLRC
mmetsp:Transcript_7372/g.29042  ORF Transcript_7372/g.29042 Transcript_7372/m.29042 type:complete len:539 (-) Transcript_7372:2-1618(-)